MADIALLFHRYMSLESRRKSSSLSVVELEEWSELKEILNTHFQPGVSKEHAAQRDSIRVPTHLNVSFESYGEIREVLMTNLSRGGIFVASDRPLPIGTKVRVKIRVEESGNVINVPGEVVSQNIGADLVTEERGMGLRFVGLNPSQKKVVDALYQKALQGAFELGD